MTDWLSLVNFGTGAAGLVLTSLGLILAIFCRPIERWTRSYFISTLDADSFGRKVLELAVVHEGRKSI